MLFLNAESIQLSSVDQETIEYAGKIYYQTERFRLGEILIAEEKCRETWKKGQSSLLTECDGSWLLFCESIADQATALELMVSQPATVQAEAIMSQPVTAPVEPEPAMASQETPIVPPSAPEVSKQPSVGRSLVDRLKNIQLSVPVPDAI